MIGDLQGKKSKKWKKTGRKSLLPGTWTLSLAFLKEKIFKLYMSV
jgi:hypothetical protein